MPTITIETLPLFLVFVVPGFVALKVYDLLVPSARRNASQSIVDILTYSMINLGLMSWAVYLLNIGGFSERHPYWYMTLHLPILVVSPALLAIGWHWLQTISYKRGWRLSPIPTGWDKAFGVRKRYWIIFHLKNGKRVGGFYGENSHTSSFPTEPDIYVEEAWKLDERNRFAANVPGTAGLLVRWVDCDLIEFFQGG